MKNIRTKTCVWLFLLMTGFLASASYARDISLTRSQTWARLQVNAKCFENGMGALIMAGSRYNTGIDKTVDGGPVQIDPQDAWLQEFWFGPTYSRKLSKKLSFSSNLVYRPQWWYADHAGGEEYWRHTIANSYSLTFKAMPKAAIFSRMMLWDHLPATAGDNRELGNELYIRPLIGLRFPLWPRVELMIDEEVYLKPTADSDDLEGKEWFYRNAIWAGANLQIVDNLKLTLNYVHMYTRLSNTPELKQQTTDHYLFLNAAWSLDFSGKNKGKHQEGKL